MIDELIYIYIIFDHDQMKIMGMVISNVVGGRLVVNNTKSVLFSKAD